jgi:hypothetical protein
MASLIKNPPEAQNAFQPIQSTPTATASKITPSHSELNLFSATITRTTLERDVDVGVLNSSQFREYLLAKPPDEAHHGLAGQHQADMNEIKTATKLGKVAHKPLARILNEMSAKIWNEWNPKSEGVRLRHRDRYTVIEELSSWIFH